MRSKPLVSVIIPFFNDTHLLRTSVPSVLSQSYRHIEAILVDDGSTEPIYHAKRFVDSDQRVRLISIPHGGTAAARNAGLESAAGEYVAFLDIDDWFEPGKIDTQLEAMENSSTLVSHTSYQVVFPSRRLGPVPIRSGHDNGLLFPQVISSCSISMSTLMIHRSIIDKGERFRVAKRDTDCPFFASLAVDHIFLGIDKILSTVRYRPTSAPVNLVAQIEGITIHRDIFASEAKFQNYVEELAVLTDNIALARRKLETSGDSADEAAITATFGRLYGRLGRLRQFLRPLD